MSPEGKLFQITNYPFQELRDEDRRFNWSKGPQRDISGRPHHLDQPSWAGHLQKEFGPHRRGPTRRSR